MRLSLACSMLCVFAFVACASTRSTTTSSAQRIVIDRTKRAQTMDGLGWNVDAFVWANDLGHDAHKELAVLDDAHEPKPAYLRLAGWMSWWSASGPKTETPVTHEAVAAADITKRGIELDVGVWDLPDELVDSNRNVNASATDIASTIATYAKFLEDHGAKVSALEVQNEPAIAALSKYVSPAQLVDAGRALVDALDAHGLQHVRLHAPNADRPSHALSWAKPWFADEKLRARSAAVSFHTWWDDDESTYRDIATFAASVDKPVWATEDGACAKTESDCPIGSKLDPSTWETAWDTALSTWRAIAWAHASRVYHWELVGNNGAITKTGAHTPTYDVYAQLAEAVRPASVALADVRAPPGVRALAFDSGVSVDVVLLSATPQTVSIDLPKCSMTRIVRSTREQQRHLILVDAHAIELPRSSVTTARFACER